MKQPFPSCSCGDGVHVWRGQGEVRTTRRGSEYDRLLHAGALHGSLVHVVRIPVRDHTKN